MITLPSGRISFNREEFLERLLPLINLPVSVEKEQFLDTISHGFVSVHLQSLSSGDPIKVSFTYHDGDLLHCESFDWDGNWWREESLARDIAQEFLNNATSPIGMLFPESERTATYLYKRLSRLHGNEFQKLFADIISRSCQRERYYSWARSAGRWTEVHSIVRNIEACLTLK